LLHDLVASDVERVATTLGPSRLPSSTFHARGNMNRKSIFSVLAVSGLSLVPESSSAFATTPDPCLAPAANSTINVTAAGQQSEVTSPDAAYSITACGGYVVDVKGVDASPSATGAIATVTSNKQACELSADHVRYYKKAAGAATFTEIAQGFHKGNWIPPGGLFANTCQMNTIGTVVPTFVTGIKGDTIRVVVRATENASPVKVKIGGKVAIPPPG
jgi:hypothetical protein